MILGKVYLEWYVIYVIYLLCVWYIFFTIFMIFPGQAVIFFISLEIIRTTRTPAFCDTPPRTGTAPWLQIIVIHIRPHVKSWQSQSYKFKKNAKISNFETLQGTLHATHQLLDKMCKYEKYEMDPTRTVGATERTWDAGRPDGRSDTNIPQQLRCAGGIIMQYFGITLPFVYHWQIKRHDTDALRALLTYEGKGPVMCFFVGIFVVRLNNYIKQVVVFPVAQVTSLQCTISSPHISALFPVRVSLSPKHVLKQSTVSWTISLQI